MVFRNGVKTVYAKINADTLKEEEGTKAFYSKDIAVLEQRKNFEPGNIDKYTYRARRVRPAWSHLRSGCRLCGRSCTRKRGEGKED